MNTKLVIAIITGAALAAGATAVQARTAPGLAGQPYLPQDYQCFNNGAGAVFNTCANTVKTYCMSLPVDSGTHTVQATALSPNSTHAISCQATVVDRNAGVLWASQLKGTPVFNAFSIIDLGTVSVGSTNALFLCCNMPDTTLLTTVAW
jgi:hypothetical protein